MDENKKTEDTNPQAGECLDEAACSSRRFFETWYEADSMPFEHSNWFERDDEGDYKIDHVDASWEAWQAGWKARENVKVSGSGKGV